MAAKLTSATYTKDSGERSERALIIENSGNMLALDVSHLAESERAKVVDVYNEWLKLRADALKNAVQPFDDFAQARGIEAPQVKSFKLSGLTLHG